MAALFAFLHHVAAFTLVSAVAVEFVQINDELTIQRARRLQITDMVLGASAGVLFVVGVLRVHFFEKGETYYAHSLPFIVKFSLFVILALLSIYPTVEFLSWRKALKQGHAPVVSVLKMRHIRMVLHVELAGIVVILLCAALMARGIGMIS
jgi:putative membrane protein